MKATFDVLDRGWIPVVSESGEKLLLGIRDTLARAHELREISDPSPLEEYSLYRFLGLFLMDALRPEEEADIEDLYENGRFDMEQVERYIAQCRSEGVSFDLFDEERPFLQSKYDPKCDGQEKPVAALDCTLPSGNNHTHFHHARPERLGPERSLRLLLATYWFCTAGAQGYPSGVYGAPPFFGVIKGTNLFETLTALLIPVENIGIPFDTPPILWRRREPIQGKAEIGSTSWLHGLLFPTRRIHLIPDESGAVIGAHISQGENYLNKEAWRDPYATYRSNDASVFPLRPHMDSPIWRNYCDIIDIPGNHASQMLRLYRSIQNAQDVHLTLYGVETSQASYLSVHRHDLTFPVRLAERDTIDLLTACIDDAQQLRRSLEKALRDISAVPSSAVSNGSVQFDKVCETRFWLVCEKMSRGEHISSQVYNDYRADIAKDVLRVFDACLKSLKLRAHSLSDAEENRRRLSSEANKLRKKEGKA